MLRAEITAGNVHGSTSVTVDVTGQSSGVVVLVCRGTWVLGTATVPPFAATINVPVTVLSSGDVIQASYTERGAGAGVPVRVVEPGATPTGWLDPTSIIAPDDEGIETTYDASTYETAFGAQPAAYYDPLTAGTVRIPQNYEYNPEFNQVDFDLLVEQRAGQTTLTVLARPGDSLLVGWNGATPSAAAPLTITTSAGVSVVVKRDTDNLTATRTVSATVLPSAPAGSGVINSASYRYSNTSFLSVYVNSAVPCEVAIPGIMSGAYQPCISYDPKYQQVNFESVPPANRTATIRAVGETNPANYFSLQLPLL